jgi:SnoaL-like domain
MTEVTHIVQRYLDTWNETDPESRRALLATVWAEDASYVDPLASVRGHDEISALIDAVHAQVPGHVFSLLGNVDGHHSVCRFSWELVPESGGESVAVGFDVAETNGDGRIQSVIGFLDKAPAA